jgi:hypothetical protein
MNRKLLGTLVTLALAVIAGLILAACTFSLEPVNALDTDGIANGNTGLIKVTNRSGNPGVPLLAVRIIQQDETSTEHRYAPALPGYDSDLTGLVPANSKEYRFPAGLTYRIKFQTNKGWTNDAARVSVVKGQTVDVYFEGDEPVTSDTVDKGTLTVWNKIPGDYVIEEIRISCGEAGRETEVLIYEKEIKAGDTCDFDEVPTAVYYVRARIKNPASGKVSKWSVPALAGQADGSIPAGSGEEITVTKDTTGVAVFDANVLLDDGSGVNAPLEEVSNLTVTQGEEKFTLEWKDPADDDVYQIEISCTDTEGKTVSQTVLKNREMAVITGLKDGESYSIWVKTMDAGGNKSAGVEKVVVMGSDTPDEVAGLIAATGDRKVRLTWTDPADADFDHIEISYSADSGLIRTLPPVTKGLQLRTIDSLNYGTIYAFTVKTVNTSGNKSQGTLVLGSIAKVVTDFDLGQYITAPAAGAVRDLSPFAGTQYTGTITSWRTISGAGLSDDAQMTTPYKYVEGKGYRARIVLTPNAGYTFAGLTSTSFTFGAAAVVTGLDGAVIISTPVLGKTWYVSEYGNAGNDGSDQNHALDKVQTVLDTIKSLHQTPHSTWTTAEIVIIGTSQDTDPLVINDTDGSSDAYPPILLRGLGPSAGGVLTADKSNWTGSGADGFRVLDIRNGAEVTLGNNLTITGGGARGTVASGAGVYVFGTSSLHCTFTMNGGTITGNTATSQGGAVECRYSTFTMNGGVISHNTASGSAVAINATSTFTMNAGAITNNTSSSHGGGVRVLSLGIFTMKGGTIAGNSTGNDGGGVSLNSGATFNLEGGAITGNKAAISGGGVGVRTTAIFNMSGGAIANNSAVEYGGGVNLNDDSVSFTMKGGTIEGNTAKSGGGGVAVLTGTGVFTKGHADPALASGIIYGSNGGANRNTVTSAENLLLDDRGHAVYIQSGPKTRETTVLPDQSLDSGAVDGWAE